MATETRETGSLIGSDKVEGTAVYVRAKSVLPNRLSERPALRRGPGHLGISEPKYNRTQADQRLVQRSIVLCDPVHRPRALLRAANERRQKLFRSPSWFG
jgi:hypothetical protein